MTGKGTFDGAATLWNILPVNRRSNFMNMSFEWIQQRYLVIIVILYVTSYKYCLSYLDLLWDQHFVLKEHSRIKKD